MEHVGKMPKEYFPSPIFSLNIVKRHGIQSRMEIGFGECLNTTFGAIRSSILEFQMRLLAHQILHIKRQKLEGGKTKQFFLMQFIEKCFIGRLGSRRGVENLQTLKPLMPSSYVDCRFLKPQESSFPSLKSLKLQGCEERP
ncbi:hypothetical protein L1987_52043 [Smallanthus sonchifolius]|uniref:Uncharacterized protein n=1 Tax=Smallanthus sonchifolius TaxID=185202 RepID=A0ACB9ET64_9ASTR|nr:hypothetical protein L1987_52043 [Smallanthus sonchifolius]